MYHLFFFNDTATTEIYTLSLHDALPICPAIVSLSRRARFRRWLHNQGDVARIDRHSGRSADFLDRKSTRLNSSHQIISYAVFCLKKKKMINTEYYNTRKSNRRSCEEYN